jgi:hypothetical protein
MIHFLEHKLIDKIKWDNCMVNSGNRMIYGLSWYLDIVSPDWDALIEDDYKTIMPLLVRSKFGMKYIFKSFHIQQLGVFGNDISAELISSYIKQLPKKIKLADLFINEQNSISEKYDDIIIKEHNNFKLEIDKTYPEIQKGYNRNARRNINSALKAQFHFQRELNVNEFGSFIQDNLEYKIKSFNYNDLFVLNKLANEAIHKNLGEIVCIRDRNDVLVATGFFLFSFDRLIFLVCASTEEGKRDQSMHMLVDEQIKNYAGKFKWFDFSGSNLPGVAYFNSTFGAKPVKYQSLRINNLPGFIRYLLKIKQQLL